MLKFIQLEVRKINLRLYVWTTVITSLSLALFSILIPFLKKMESGSTRELFTTYQSAFSFINIMNGTVIVVFASVLIANLVVSEYNNRTIIQLFTYPINRKKLMLSKILFVGIWTFSAVVVTGALSTTVFWIGNQLFHFLPEPLTLPMVVQQGINIVFLAFSSVGLGLITMFIGLKSKSVPATILSSLLMAGFLNFNPSGVSLSMIAIVPLSFSIFGFIVAYLSIRKLDYEDVH